jgi:hypothetical protein
MFDATVIKQIGAIDVLDDVYGGGNYLQTHRFCTIRPYRFRSSDSESARRPMRRPGFVT